jgi:hypothetical protein
MIRAKEKLNDKISREVERVSMRGSMQGGFGMKSVNQSMQLNNMTNRSVA